jgi:hypothetical protein
MWSYLRYRGFEFIGLQIIMGVHSSFEQHLRTNEQHLHLQQDALTAAGCLKIYTDTISGAKSERKGLFKCCPKFGYVPIRIYKTMDSVL